MKIFCKRDVIFSINTIKKESWKFRHCDCFWVLKAHLFCLRRSKTYGKRWLLIFLPFKRQIRKFGKK